MMHLIIHISFSNLVRQNKNHENIDEYLETFWQSKKGPLLFICYESLNRQQHMQCGVLIVKWIEQIIGCCVANLTSKKSRMCYVILLTLSDSAKAC